MKSNFKMKALVAAAMLAGAMTGSAHAASTSGTFNVDINLTSACSVSTITNVAFAYTSFQGAAQSSTGGGFTVTCTNSLPYTFGLQAGNGAPTPPGAATINVTDDAVNLAYTLGTSAAGGTGSGAIQAYTLTGTMAAGQGGTCGSATCTNAAATNRIHTLIVNW
jgi:spore coat protein U-like protein